MESKCIIFKIENASPCTYIWYPTTSHHTPAAVQAGPTSSSLLPCFHICPPQSGLHCSQRDSARTCIRSCLTFSESLPVAPRSLLWTQGPTGPGRPHHPTLPLARSTPAHQLPHCSSNTPARFLSGPLHWLFSLPGALFPCKSPDSLLSSFRSAPQCSVAP